MAAASYILKFITLLLILQVVIGDEEEPFQCRQLYEFDAGKNPTGDLYSPLYKEKGEYNNGLWCEYRITAPEGYRLKLTFKDLDIDPSYYCHQDALLIYDKDQEYKIDTICGSTIPEPFITDPGVNIVHLVFRTDELFIGRGFHLQYEAAPDFDICPGLKMCENRKCFDEASQKCNGVDDCGDGTDEVGCDLPLDTAECGKPSINPDTIFGKLDRIIGGQQVIPGSWPWQVSMQNKHGLFSHSCGGSLINAQWVLTAAHCFRGNTRAENWRIHVGKHHKYIKDPHEQIRYVERIIIWPDKTAETLVGSFYLLHDIALVKLSAPVKFTEVVQPICLPPLGWDLQPETTCYATGWGETRGTGSHDALKQVDVQIMPRTKCGYDEKSQICVRNLRGYHSTCHGDSGGPLACRLGGKWYVMGATSFGTETNFMQGLCALPNQKTVFMRVSDKTEWIQGMIEKYG